jgi:hypothetical protein
LNAFALSSGVDVYTAIAGATGALYGPLHGGANEVRICTCPNLFLNNEEYFSVVLHIYYFIHSRQSSRCLMKSEVLIRSLNFLKVSRTGKITGLK